MKITVTMQIDLGNAEAVNMGLDDAANQYAQALAQFTGEGVNSLKCYPTAPQRYYTHDGNGNRVGVVDVTRDVS